MKVAIVGAGRNRNGIGRFIGKYFQNNNADVISVLGTTAETAGSAAAALQQYGVQAAAYTNFAAMMSAQKPDIIVIASPHASHYEYLIKCIEARTHIFCEKPFVWPPAVRGRDAVATLFRQAAAANIRIGMNSQWPFILPYYETLCGPLGSLRKEKFFISMRPISSGSDMIPDAVPHALSIVYAALGGGAIENPYVETERTAMHIQFLYRSAGNDCDVRIELIHQQQQPRDFLFGFDNKLVERVIDVQDYTIAFKYQDNIVSTPDPLELSVKDFLTAVRGQREPRIGKQHILDTAAQLQTIYDTCKSR